jgi:hypothetical protein
MSVETELIPVAAFLKRRLNKLGTVHGRRDREKLLTWLAWHSARFNACVIRSGQKIVAVGVARAIKEEVDARFPYKQDETGTICYVEQVAASSNEGFKMLLTYVSKRWKQCDKIMFYRAKSHSKNKIYPMKEFLIKSGVTL